MTVMDSHVMNSVDVGIPMNMHFPTGQFFTKHGSTVKVPVFKDYNMCTVHTQILCYSYCTFSYIQYSNQQIHSIKYNSW